MARIGIDIRNIGKQRTGDEVVFFNLVKNLAQIDQENNYFLFTDIQDREVLSKIGIDLGIFTRNNFQIVSLNPGHWLGKFVWNFWTLPRYLRKNPVDIYHTQYITPFFVSKKIKIITTIHDVSFLAFPQHIKFFDLFFLRTLIPLSVRRADKIIGVSEFTRAEIIKHYQVESPKVGVVYNAVADDFLRKEITEQEKLAVREKYALPEKFLLYVGTLQPRKNIPLLVEAYAEFKKEFPEFKLVLAGNRQAHNFDHKIEAVIKDKSVQDSVIFPGFVAEADKKALFSLATVFIFPSLYEGFGVPILEAFAAGVPVVASDIAPHREVAGAKGCFFAATQVTDLTDKIRQLLRDEPKRATVVANGRQRVQEFAWEQSAHQLLAIYQGLTKTHS